MIHHKKRRYKGPRVLTFSRDKEDKFHYQIGLRKARMIVENIGEIRAFVMRHEKGFME